METIKTHYQTMLQKFKGGLSNTSTQKFDEIVAYISQKFGIKPEDIYATGSGTRPGNLEVRLSQGIRATVHTTLGLGFIKDDKNSSEHRIKLTNSAFVTITKFLGRGKANYDNIAIFIESEDTLFPMGLIYKEATPLSDSLIESFQFPILKDLSKELESDQHLFDTNTDEHSEDSADELFEKMSADERIAAFLQHMKSQKLSDSTVNGYVTGLRSAVVRNIVKENIKGTDDWFEVSSLDQLRHLHGLLDAYRKERQQTPEYSTAKNYASYSGKYLDFVQMFMYNHLMDNLPNRPRQIITYGAPGTGKSFATDTECKKYKEEQTIRTTFHPDTDYASFVGTYKPIKDKDGKITYEFVPQAFMKAYIKAWEDRSQPVFLIIEEINRGNCAQIFGDIFQLLDRNDDEMSSYDISTSQEIQDHIAKFGLKVSGVFSRNDEDISDKIAKGEIMALPENLYIWATMNTSDQSLFPIDSAFKRRWEWKYVKIAKGKDKETGEEFNWKLEANDQDWWEFIKQINRIIANMTSSADKQLGYFFCKPDNGETISYERFVNKVLFYLWNDVFKDYGFDDKDLFTFADEDGHQQDLTFPDFFGETGDDIETARVDEFVQKVMSWEKKSND